jgi:Family of unknown function (DUF6527)
VTRTEHYTAEFVEPFPTPMAPGVLYVSTTHSTAGHICPCGCGREVIAKLSRARWRVVYDGEVSLQPSIAAAGLPCNSHYFITRGEVDWRRELDAVQKAKARSADQQAITLSRASASTHGRWWSRLKRRLAGRARRTG